MNDKQKELLEQVTAAMNGWTDAERAEFMQGLAEDYCPLCGYKTMGVRCTCTATMDT